MQTSKEERARWAELCAQAPRQYTALPRLLADYEELEHKVRELEADKARLDTLESDDIVYLGDDEAGGYRIDTISGPVYEGDTVRECCDKMLAARATPAEPEPKR